MPEDCTRDYAVWNIFFMELVLVYSLAIFATVAGCRFGLEADCEYICHCMHNEPCDSTTGDCANGCDDGSPDGYMWRGAWSGTGCQLGNLAYGLLATGSNYMNYGTPASLSVDGNRNPVYADGSCSYLRANNWSELFWLVNLGSLHVINNLTVYGTKGRTILNGHNYWRSRVVEVGDAVRGFSACGTLGDNNTALQVYVVCPEPLLGTQVRIRASQYDSNMPKPRLFLCEVYVDGYRFTDCINGAFGPGCLTACHCRDQCDVISGQCSSQCDEGWAGSNCQERLPVLVIFATVMKANQNYLEVEVVVEEPSPSGGSWSWFCTVEIRREGDEEWHELSVISRSTSGVVTLKKSYNFTLHAIYDLRVVPWFTYEGATYQGIGEDSTTFTVKAPAGSSSTVIVVLVVLVVLLVVITVAIVIVLRRRGILKPTEVRFCLQSRIMGVYTYIKGNKNTSGPTSATSVVDDNIYDQVSVSVVATAPPQSAQGENTDPAAICEIEISLDMQTKPKFVPVELGVPAKQPPPEDNSGEEPVQNIYGNEVPMGRPIKVQDLSNYVQDMKKQPTAFKLEYAQIPSGQTALWTIATAKPNKGKHRFNNIMAYDHSRVKLDVSLGGDQGEGYINANFIPGYKDVSEAYIAAQGPLVRTVVDMWQMIWQYKINRVVMVARTMEQGKVKCERYWPESTDSGEQEFGEFNVKLVKTDTYADYVIRTLSVLHKGESRRVIHFHFVGWPDHGVPLVATSLLEFRRKVRTFDNEASGPLVVHCSAGVGRSGAYIALDYLLDQAIAEGEVDVFKYTALMRTHRINMIQNLAQYIFVYDALLQGLFYANTAIPCSQLAEVFSRLQRPERKTKLSPLQKQFEGLEQFKPPETDDNLDGLRSENLDKNRNGDIIPFDKSRPFLFPRLDERGNYINAAFIDSYRRQKAFIVTQVPLPQTIGDFWQMLYDHRSPSIVLLHAFDHSDPEHELCPQYWPPEVDDVMRLDALEVELEAEDMVEDDIISRQFRITNTANEKEEPLVVTQLHLTGWPADVDTPEDPAKLITLLEVLERWQQKSGDKTVTVQCRTGAHHSGILCAASYVLEKLKVDQEVDAFMAVSQTRLGRPQLIHSLDQYAFLHEIALKFMEGNETYANFKYIV